MKINKPHFLLVFKKCVKQLNIKIIAILFKEAFIENSGFEQLWAAFTLKLFKNILCFFHTTEVMVYYWFI